MGSRRLLLVSLMLVLSTSFVPSSGAARALEGIRGFRHVVVLVLENENFSTTWGKDSAAHYLNSLVPFGVFADQYYATGHASLDNYIAMISGQPDMPLTGLDCGAISDDHVVKISAPDTLNLWTCAHQQLLFSNGRNLPDQLDEKHLSWKAYMDSMPSPCFHADYSPTAIGDPYHGNSREPPATDYTDRHNPFIYFPNIVENTARCRAHVRPYTELANDIRNDRVPRFSFIVPDTCHDGHDQTCSNGQPGGIVAADKWLKGQVPSLLSYLRAHDGLLIITLDENGFTDTSDLVCCHGGLLGILPSFGGRIGLLAIGPGLKAGKVVSTPYDHMSLLRTIEDSFGIGEYLNNAAASPPMTDIFR
jgi:phospholipase C